MTAAPAFDFAGARSFVGFEGAAFRFTKTPEHPPIKTNKAGKKIHNIKFRWHRKSSPYARNVKVAPPGNSKPPSKAGPPAQRHSNAGKLYKLSLEWTNLAMDPTMARGDFESRSSETANAVPELRFY
jgi:hypothetical protein